MDKATRAQVVEILAVAVKKGKRLMIRSPYYGVPSVAEVADPVEILRQADAVVQNRHGWSEIWVLDASKSTLLIRME